VTVTVEKKQFTLCSLIPEKIEQAPLDHVFNEGEEISFAAFGNRQAGFFSFAPSLLFDP